MTQWFFTPMPLGRVAVLRTAVYLFVVLDVLVVRAWVADHGDVAGNLYHPVLLGRLLPLPTPTPTLVEVVRTVLVATAVVAATGRLPRLAGTTVALLYIEWQVIAFSYGKVDHDRFAFLVALVVLPTLGRARWGDRSVSEAAGWAIRAVQLAVVATYFLSVFAKLRYGGLEWLNSATLLRALVRRGTDLADPLIENAWILHVGQYLIVVFELLSPLLLVRGRTGRIALAVAASFHLMTYLTLTITFLPHLVAMLSFLPLERIPRPRLPEPAASRLGVRAAGGG